MLLASLHGRNPGVLNTGDVILRLMLFWAMFLPLGACWSLDAARRGRTGGRRTVVAGGAAAALLLQIAFIYVFNVQFKTGAAWRTDFTALERALAGETWITPWGEWLLRYPELLSLMTRFVITLEMFGPLLLFLPICVGPARTLAVVLFGGFHLGILLGMRIGIFPIACIVAWLAVLPTRVGPLRPHTLAPVLRLHPLRRGAPGHPRASRRLPAQRGIPGIPAGSV